MQLPDDLTETEQIRTDKIYNPGTHQQTSSNNNTEGCGFIITISKDGSKATVKASKYSCGNIRYVKKQITIPVADDNALRDALTDAVKDYDLSNYVGSYMIQVPAYLNACLTNEDNALIYLGQLFEKDSDASNNGGYNLFEVFVENLFGMYQQFIDKGMLSQKAFELIKEREYKTWLVGYVVDLLILKRSKRMNFDQTDAWSILRKYYGGYLYFYSATLIHVLKSVARPMYHLIKKVGYYESCN